MGKHRTYPVYKDGVNVGSVYADSIRTAMVKANQLYGVGAYVPMPDEVNSPS